MFAAGCGRTVDESEARLCRSLIVGLAGSEATVIIRATRAAAGPVLGGEAVLSGVEIAYDSGEGAARTRHVLGCYFTRPREGAALPRDLQRAEVDGQALSAERLYFARRFWLETADAAAADPEPIAGLGRAGRVPRAVAMGLQAVVAGLPETGVIVLLSLALALVQGLSGRVNLAWGEIGALGSYGAVLGVAAAGGTHAPGLAVLAGLALGIWTAGVVGGAAGQLVLGPLAAERGQAPLIAGLALAIIIAETARLAQGAGLRPSPPMLDQPLALARAEGFVVTTTAMDLIATAVAFATAAAVVVVMLRSRLGRRWRAAADDEIGAALLGVDPAALALRTHVLAGLVAGAAGAIVGLAMGGASQGTGLILGLKAAMAAVLGGAGSLGGAALAGLAIGLVEAVWGIALPIEHRDAAVLAIVAGLLVARPGGFAGLPGLERKR